MGGYGSGRSGGRPTSEACGSLVLQTTTFLRAGLRFGVKGNATLTFTADGEPFPVSVTIDTLDRDYSYIEFSHSRRSHPASFENYRVTLLTTPQRYGGVRWWFQCPRTGARAVRLFLPRGGHQFWSRGAYRLGYATQREGRMDRISRRATKLCMNLGGNDNWRDGPPTKPKWMRWETYSRRACELRRLNEDFDSAWLVGASRLISRLHRR